MAQGVRIFTKHHARTPGFSECAERRRRIEPLKDGADLRHRYAQIWAHHARQAPPLRPLFGRWPVATKFVGTNPGAVLGVSGLPTSFQALPSGGISPPPCNAGPQRTYVPRCDERRRLTADDIRCQCRTALRNEPSKRISSGWSWAQNFAADRPTPNGDRVAIHHPIMRRTAPNRCSRRTTAANLTSPAGDREAARRGQEYH